MNPTIPSPSIDAKGHRPLAITIVCILGFLGLAVVLLGLMNSSIRERAINEFGILPMIFSVIIGLAGAGGLIGCWLMRKWGVYLYTAAQVISLLLNFFTQGSRALTGSIFSVVVIVILFAYLKRMR